MKKILPALLAAALFSLVFTSCSKDEEDKYDGNLTLAYFPLEVGHYVTYQVDSTYWDKALCLRTIHKMQHRYQVADTFTDAEGRFSYRIDILTRSADSVSWSMDEVIYATRTNDRLEIRQNNVALIRQIFPISNGRSWKGNALIPAGDQDYAYMQGWDYQYTNLGGEFNNGLNSYKNTLTVNQVDKGEGNPEVLPAAYAYRTFGKDVYAYGIGLVFREITHWVYDPSTGNACREGYSVTLRAIDHN